MRSMRHAVYTYLYKLHGGESQDDIELLKAYVNMVPATNKELKKLNRTLNRILEMHPKDFFNSSDKNYVPWGARNLLKKYGITIVGYQLTWQDK